MKKIKALFETPNKAAVTIACILAILAALSIATVYATSAIAEGTSIGTDRAEAAALADAGVDPAQVASIQTEFEFEQGQFVYQVEFTAGNTEYEYLINASNGSVIKKEKETFTGPGADPTIPAAITLDEAKSIALTDAGIALDAATFTEEELELHNGMPVYELKFFLENSKYEYEINADTGVIYSKSTEVYLPQGTAPTGIPSAPPAPTAQPSQSSQPVPSAAPTAPQPPVPSSDPPPAATMPILNSVPPAPSQITLDEAKNAALTDAGVTASAVTYTKAAMDREDGIWVYDIEFYTSTHEYEYEIVAADGSVCSKSIEALPAGHGHGHHSSTPAAPGDAYIGIEDAKSAALSHAGLTAAEVVFSKAELDYDDGLTAYEVEFYVNGVEYEYKIDAVSGAVLECERERH